jgi:hypothetical protein
LTIDDDRLTAIEDDRLAMAIDDDPWTALDGGLDDRWTAIAIYVRWTTAIYDRWMTSIDNDR